MNKKTILYVAIFIGIFLIAPIYTYTYTDVGGELGAKSGWIPFGGLTLMYYGFYSLLGPYVSTYGYPDYFGDLNYLPNFTFLLLESLVFTKILASTLLSASKPKQKTPVKSNL